MAFACDKCNTNFKLFLLKDAIEKGTLIQVKLSQAKG
jgi:hypothetical protein